MRLIEATSRAIGAGAILASQQIGQPADNSHLRPETFVSYQIAPQLPHIQQDNVSVMQLITKPENYAGEVIRLNNVVAVPGVQNETTQVYPPAKTGQPELIHYQEIANITDVSGLKTRYPYSDAIRILNLWGRPNYEPHLADYVKFNIVAQVDQNTTSSGDAQKGLVNLTALAITPIPSRLASGIK